MRQWFFVLCLGLCACSGRHEGILLDSAREREIEYKVWLPVEAVKAPLVLLSHGSGGHYSNLEWLSNALVEAGYVVAAVNHPYNTVGDNTPEGIIGVWDRPGDLSLLLTSLLDSPRYSSAIDVQRVGAAGFSSGGYTVIALAGGIYELSRMQTYCRGEDAGPDCDLAPRQALERASAASISLRDPRIQAVLAMAPAVGPAMTPDSLAHIDLPVALFATADDELLKPHLNALFYAEHIPEIQLSIQPVGGHFLFLSCNTATSLADWLLPEFNLCGQGIDVDRKALQSDIAAQAVAFFDQTIGHSVRQDQ
tara:strand:+ start:1158 stop:2081 length:924 start_codon:yes stop_codon:yes gene_type:complete